MIFFVLLFSSIVYNIFAQTLSVCTSGDCTWNDPSSGIIPVCTKTATSCTVTVSGDHSNGKVYSAAPTTHIDCNGINGCKYGEYHCGNQLPPDYASYGLAISDFDGTVNDCYFDCTNANANVCYNANFYCKGDVKQCRIKGSGGASLHDANLFCVGITYPSATCSWDCPCCISCDRSAMQCSETMAVCSKSGSNSGNVNIVTSAPTTSPTNKPSASPTLYPTTYPSAPPTTFQPTEIPSDHPSKIPSNSPTNLPTQIPSNPPTKIPSKFPTKTPSNSPTKAVGSAEYEYVSTESIASQCIGNCGDTLNSSDSAIYGINKNVIYIIIGCVVCLCCFLLISVTMGMSLSNAKMKNELHILEQAQSVSSDNVDTVDIVFKNNNNAGETDDTLNTNVKVQLEVKQSVDSAQRDHDTGNIDDDDEDLYGRGNVAQNRMDLQTPNSAGNDAGLYGNI